MTLTDGRKNKMSIGLQTAVEISKAAAARILDTVTAVATNDDPARLARRREVRAQIAACKVVGRKVANLRRQLADVDRQITEAKDECSRTCQPLQQRLAEVEAAISLALTDRAEVDPALLNEQTELMAAIAEANTQLSDAVDRLNRLRDPLLRELHKIEAESSYTHLTNKLSQLGIAREDLFNEHFSRREAVEWAGQRVAAAAKQVKTWREHIELHEQGKRLLADVAAYRRRLRRWGVELSAAQDALTEAKAKERAAHQAMIDE
jgi:hypothetical protein